MNLQSREGQRIPEVTFRIRRNGEWQTVTSDDLFKGRNVVVFSLPGAFTPTCSSMQLPRYNELAPAFHAHGIDSIVCIAVNDPFVMEEWGRDQQCGNVTLLPDGNGHFTEGMGMLVDRQDLNFGKRSWRYAMLVRDGRIEKMFIEPQKDGDPFEVSDADTMLRYIDPQAGRPQQVALLTRQGCPFCARARQELEAAGVDHVDIDLPASIRSRALGAIAHASTTPQVFVDGERIGGAEELTAWLAKRKEVGMHSPV